ncbi:hypothetical protein N7G274_009368 [Stereocaulon virgatum]|uniref:Uncharacterized protein n=1 Tax=Stereocaulon virgatum TaxID=373712 RepID=A0ABR3ZYQ0_9LECA
MIQLKRIRSENESHLGLDSPYTRATNITQEVLNDSFVNVSSPTNSPRTLECCSNRFDNLVDFALKSWHRNGAESSLLLVHILKDRCSYSVCTKSQSLFYGQLQDGLWRHFLYSSWIRSLLNRRPKHSISSRAAIVHSFQLYKHLI